MYWQPRLHTRALQAGTRQASDLPERSLTVIPITARLGVPPLVSQLSSAIMKAPLTVVPLLRLKCIISVLFVRTPWMSAQSFSKSTSAL